MISNILLRGFKLKFKRLAVLIIIFTIIFLTSAVNATDIEYNDNHTISEDYSNLQLNDIDDVLSQNSKNIYVDDINGDDSNNGNTKEASVKSLTRALELSNDNDSIYIADGVYTNSKNTKISISKSINIIGSADTTFDGENSNYIFNISDDVKVTIKNIKFIKAYKISPYYNPVCMYGAALEINKATVTIDNCSFIKNHIGIHVSLNVVNYGGAISNFGDLTILNSYFDSNYVASDSGLYSYGGAIYNKGKASIKTTTFTNSTTMVYGNGGAIYNDGTMLIDKSIIKNSYSAQQSKGSAIFNAGTLTLTNSIIENNTVTRTNFNDIYGTIYNYGPLTAYGNIFRNNTGIYEAPNDNYKGSPTIFNIGDINATYNVFMNNAPFNGISTDIYVYGGSVISLDDNWWSTNDKPDKSKINLVEEVRSWFVFNMSPEYSPIGIGESIDILSYWSLSSTLTPKINKFPVLNVTFTNGQIISVTPLTDGEAVFKFNTSQLKGYYNVTATIGEFEKTVLVDVGKLVSNINVIVTDNVTYTDDIHLNVEVTGADGKIPTGVASLTIDKTVYIINLTNGKGSLNLSKLNPNNYNFKIAYEGNENYFKAFKNVNVTVNKAPTSLKVYFPDIKIDQKAMVTINLGPSGVQGQAYLLINGVRKKILYLYNGNTTVAVSNFAEGEYNVTVEFFGTNYYSASTASTTFKVTKYEAELNLTAKDISLGENQIISIKVNPSDLRGEAILNINGENRTIFLDSETTNITISGLNYGTYDIWVYYPANQKYSAFNTSASFKVLRTLTKLDVNIIEDGFNGTITVKTNYTDCYGSIGVYINYRLYYAELIKGVANFKVTFDKGTNYIYVFYEGDSKYEASNWNTTLGVAEDFILIGENTTAYEYNDFNYIIHLIEYNGIPMPNRVVSVKFNNKEYFITTNDDGIAKLLLNLNKGLYTITATYKNQTVSNNIQVKQVKFNVTSENITYMTNETITVEFDNNITGEVNLILNDINQTVSIADSKAIFTVPDLKVGSYTAYLKYIKNTHVSDIVSTTFEVKKANPIISTDIGDLVYNDNKTVSVKLPYTATGEVTFTLNGVSQTKQLKDGVIFIDLVGLEKGTYNVTISYDGDSNYNHAYLNLSFNVKDSYSDINLNINDAEYGKNFTVTAVLNETTTGNIVFSVANLTKTVEIKKGQANWTFTGLNSGKYEIKAYYAGDSTFISSTNTTSFNVLKTNSTLELFVNEVYLGENILIYALTSENATGSVSFSILNYYSPRNKAISNGVAVWYISPLNTGNYTIQATYSGDDNYCSLNATYSLSITQRKAVLNVEIDDVTVNDRVIVKTRLTSNGEGITDQVLLTINGRLYRINVKNGVGNLVIGRMNIGNYEYSAVYEGNANFSKSSCSGEFKVADILNLTINTNNVSYYYGANRNFIVSVVGDTDKPISNVDILVKIGTVIYNLTTDDEGKISIPINLNLGNHTVEISFEGNSRYNPAFKTANIEILSTVEGIDVVSIYGSSAQFFAILTDSNGKALGNREVRLTVGSNSYTVRTFPNGIVRVNIKFTPGRYEIVTTNPVTGQQITNTLFIFVKLMENRDVVTYYGNDQVYRVRAYDNEGNPVGEGKIVTFNVGGKTYNIKTDKNGYAVCKVNLKPNVYTITATYDGFKVSNYIVVKPVLTAKNISVKKGKVIKFKAKLVNKNGKALKGKKIKFKFNGKLYKVKTNKKGVATLKLKFKLNVGKYLIKVSYSKSKLKRIIKIKK